MNQVFISYSHADKAWLDRLLRHLKPVLRREPTAVWWDVNIMAGQRWRAEIDKALASANVGVLLVSANFLHSDFIADNELPYLLGAAKERGVKLLAVLLSNCLYDEVGLSEIQFVNPTSKPLDRCRGGNLNDTLVTICKVIRNEIDVPKPISKAPTRRAIEQQGEIQVMAEFVTESYWTALHRISGKSLDELFTALKEEESTDGFIMRCISERGRQKIFLDAIKSSGGEAEFLEKANKVRSLLGLNRYTASGQKQRHEATRL
jgi:hypothetical protein